MNDEIRAEIEETIRIISENIITQMMNEDKNTYDKEIRLPENVTTPHVVTKRAYNRITGTMYDEKNKKRRQKRPSVLEQCILNGKLEEAEKRYAECSTPQSQIYRKQRATIAMKKQPRESWKGCLQ